MKVRHAFAAAAVALSIFGSGSALAAGFYTSYNLTVPRFGGSTTTDNRTKQAQYDPAVVCNHSTGANYTLYVRVERFDNAVRSDYFPTTTGTRTQIGYNAAAGQQYHLRFATGYTTPVNVQTQGNWSPDNPGTCP
jgi:hypothetical protein